MNHPTHALSADYTLHRISQWRQAAYARRFTYCGELLPDPPIPESQLRMAVVMRWIAAVCPYCVKAAEDAEIHKTQRLLETNPWVRFSDQFPDTYLNSLYAHFTVTQPKKP